MGVVVFGKTEEHKDRFLSDRMGGWFWETEEHKDRFLRAEWRWVFGETEEHKDRFFEDRNLCHFVLMSSTKNMSLCLNKIISF